MKLRIIKLSAFEIIIAVLTILTVSAGILTYWFNISTAYADDILTLVIMISTTFTLFFAKRKMQVSIMLFLFPLMMTVIGFIGNVVSGYQNNLFAIVMDAFSWQKFFLLYACFLVILQKKENRISLYLRIAQRISKLLIIIGLLMAIFNLLGVIYLAPGYDRFGLPAFTFGSHPSNTASILAASISLLFWNEKENLKYIYIALILIVLTFRFKGIAFACLVIYFILKAALPRMKKKIKIPLSVQVLPIVLCVVFICWDQITFYFISPTASRARALATSFRIAAKIFPFGGGFASFGTLMSGVYYSDAYRKFGLSNIWGFSKQDYSFIGDGGFATIIGQLGWGGFLVVVINILIIYKFIKKKTNQKEMPISCFLVLAYLIISQSNEGAFYAENAPVFALILALLTFYFAWKPIDEKII